jgi:hypothetical protein
MASKMASLKELVLAIPFPAISYAVPWSGDVRILFNPAVKLTPSPKDNVLKGIKPWSWYVAIIASNDL